MLPIAAISRIPWRPQLALGVGAVVLAGACAQLVPTERVTSLEPSARRAAAPAPTPVVSAPTYTVVRGDTLSAIASSQGVAIDTLVALNGIADPSLIEEGRALLLAAPASAPAFERPAAPAAPMRPAWERVVETFGVTPRAARLGATVAAVPLAGGALLLLVTVVVERMMALIRAAGRGLARLTRVPRRRVAPLELAPATLVVTAPTSPVLSEPAVGSERPRRRAAGALASAAQTRVGTAGGHGLSLLGAGAQDALRAGASALVMTTSAGASGVRAALARDGAVGRRLVRGRASMEHGVQEVLLRRQGFEPGGEFWIRGSALLRLGSREAAQRHYDEGHRLCIARGWPLEAARCLERLASIARATEDHATARGHLEAAIALLGDQPEGAPLRAELAAQLAEAVDYADVADLAPPPADAPCTGAASTAAPGADGSAAS